MVNSFIYKKKKQILLISLITEKTYDVTHLYKDMVKTANIILTEADETSKEIKKIKKIVDVELFNKNKEGLVTSWKFSKEELILTAFDAARAYIEIKKNKELT